jgi:hypothetical protein
MDARLAALLTPSLPPLGVLLIGGAALEFAVRVLPLQPQMIAWRVTAESAFLSAAPLVLVGLLLLVVAAYVTDALTALRLVAMLALVYAALLLIAGTALLLDVPAVRAVAQPELQGPLRNRALGSAITGLLGVVAAVQLARGALRAAGRRDALIEREVRLRASRATPPPLIRQFDPERPS